MSRYKQINTGEDTTTVQSVITKDTHKRLLKAANRRKLSASAFIAVAIEKQLDEIETSITVFDGGAQTV